MLYLKQSTAVTLKIGPFLDETDGVSAEDGLTIEDSDVRLSKNGGNMGDKHEITTCTVDELGYYDCPLDDTDTGTLGRLQLMVSATGAIPIWHDYMVVTTNVYNTLCSTDYFDVNLVADQSVATVGTVTTLTNWDKTGYALSAAGIDGILDEALAGHSTADSTGLALKNLLKIGKNKWTISGTTLTIYDDDGVTTLYSFTLNNATAPTTKVPI